MTKQELTDLLTLLMKIELKIGIDTSELQVLVVRALSHLYENEV